MLIQLLTLLCILIYGAGILFLNRRLTAPRNYARRIWLSNLGAVIVHGALIATLLVERGINNLSFLIVLSIIAWLLGLFSVSRGRQLASLMLRPAIFGFAIVSVLLLLVLPDSQGIQGSMTLGLAAHIILSMIAFSLLVLAALYAGQILYLNRVLKKRSARALDMHLPPLMAVEQYFFRLLTAGTVVLTFAIIAGILFVDGLFAHDQIHKTILSFAAWLGFGGIVVAHATRGLRGKPIVLLTLVAASLLTLAYFGSRFVRDIILS
ncbi:MAG TPA: cytochrome c biogenesis protein CcsA [Aliidiomarina sp.]|nr:cytochrome c biogenesis protein CcsA [Aliidiomarina sp.]